MIREISVPVKYIFVDVVDYTEKNRSVEAQTDIINSLNQLIKKSLKEFNFKRNNHLLIPTGDGVCIALIKMDETLDIHMRFAISLLESIHLYNRGISDTTRKYGIRIGINSNEDNLIKDINGNKNIAGVGVNLASRIMDLADRNQIIVGENVYSVLSSRENYINSFRRYNAKIKHDIFIPVYQYISKEFEFLNCEVPAVFKPAPKPNKEEIKLEKMVAYYFAHAIKNKKFFATVDDDDRSEVGRLLLWLLSIDSIEISESSELQPPLLMTYKAENGSIQEQYEYYRLIDFKLLITVADLITKQYLDKYYDYFDRATFGKHIFLKDSGIDKLKKDWPQIYSEFIK